MISVFHQEYAPLPIQVSTDRQLELCHWEWMELPSNSKTEIAPDESDLRWKPAVVPGTAAAAAELNGDDIYRESYNLDASDHYFRCKFSVPDSSTDVHSLRFDGLATVADVWLDDVHILTSKSMFQGHHLLLEDLGSGEHLLLIRFSALETLLAERRTRPQWKTKLVRDQNLRFIRTSLIGRMPGWAPFAAPVGPYRSVSLTAHHGLNVARQSLLTQFDAQTRKGRLELGLSLHCDVAVPVNAVLKMAGQEIPCTVDSTDSGEVRIHASTELRDLIPWYPSTHGAPHLYSAKVLIKLENSTIASIDGGKVGFREIEIDRGGSGDDFSIRLNGVDIFCRGAVWSVVDLARLGGSREQYQELLELARDAGMNMLRLSGTMTYEDNVFYELCDELGILVWQDFMFANMDYPIDDPEFAASVELEAKTQIERLSKYACVTVFCGGSEVYQQAAMLGLREEIWRVGLFSKTLAELCNNYDRGAIYIENSPSGGDLPFYVNSGVGHYYGVGAYKQPVSDARISVPKFATECLAFSIPPEGRTLSQLLPNGESPGHHPKYKQGVPRDHGSGWDFADITDHYLKLLFGVDPQDLRYNDMNRYLYLSRITPGEVMERVIAFWRRREGGCAGALIWLYKDLVLGSGWGLLDSLGVPKAPYYYLKRAFAPISLHILNEGVNGLSVYIYNETESPVTGDLEVALYGKGGETGLDTHIRTIDVDARSEKQISVESLIGRFVDCSNTYRFGPSGVDVVFARIVVDRKICSQGVFFPTMSRLKYHSKPPLTASIAETRVGEAVIRIEASEVCQSIHIDSQSWLPEDNYFHMASGDVRIIKCRKSANANQTSAGHVRMLNASGSRRLQKAS